MKRMMPSCTACTARGHAARYAALFLAVSVAACWYAMGCGNDGTADSTTSSTGVTVSGTLAAPTSANIAVAKSLGKAITSSAAAAAGWTGSIFNLNNEAIATFTADSAGKVSVTITDTSKLVADTEGKVHGVLRAADSTGKQVLMAYIEFSSTAAGTTIDIGEISVEDLLAYRSILEGLGCTEWGTECAAKINESKPDIDCMRKMEEKQWADCNATSGEGLADDCGIARSAVEGAFVAGIDLAAQGYASPEAYVDAVMNGNAASTISTLSSDLSSATGVSAASLVDNYSTAVEAVDTINELHKSIATSLGKTAVQGDSSLCGSGDSNDEVFEVVEEMFKSCESVAECKKFKDDPDILKLIVAVVEEFVDNGKIAELKGAVAGVVSFCGSMRATDADAFFENGEKMASSFTNMYQALDAAADDPKSSFAAWDSWGEQMYSTVLAAESTYGDDFGDGFKLFNGSGNVFDESKLDFYDNLIDQGQDGKITYDPTKVSTYNQSWDSAQTAVGTGNTSAFNACLDGGTAYTTCVSQAGGTGTVYDPSGTQYTYTGGTQQQSFSFAGSWTFSGDPSYTGQPTVQFPAPFAPTGTGPSYTSSGLTVGYSSGTTCTASNSLGPCTTCTVNPTATPATLMLVCPAGTGGVTGSVTYRK